MTNLRSAQDMTGVLLAGGRSSRLGQPKALVEFDGRPLGLHLLDRLAQVTGRQVIVANDPAPYLGWGVPVIGDPPEFAGMGPLAGILAALVASPGGTVLPVACDLPFFSAELGRYMLGLSASEGVDVVIPAHAGLLEPLCAVYATACRAPIVRKLAAGNRRVASILADVRVRYLPEEEYRRFGETDRLFFNVNTAADLAFARRMWLEGSARAGPE